MRHPSTEVPFAERGMRGTRLAREMHGCGREGSRAVQGRQGRGTVGTAEHEGRTHRWPAASGAVPVELKVAEIAAVHPAVALVGLALLLQHHAPPFCPRVLEPDLGTRQAEGSAVTYGGSRSRELRGRGGGKGGKGSRSIRIDYGRDVNVFSRTTIVALAMPCWKEGGSLYASANARR